MTTIDGLPGFFNVIKDSTGSRIKILTNIIKVDTDPSNEDNKKIFYIRDYYYDTLYPYFTYVNGEPFFNTVIPNSTHLIIIIKINNSEQYEFHLNVDKFEIVSIVPDNGEIEVSTSTDIVLTTNINYNEVDLVSTKAWLELLD